MTRDETGSEPDTLLSVDHLDVTIHLRDRDVHPVTDVTFEVDRDETVGVVGESGSGKSVLVRAVMGLIAPGKSVSRSGAVRFDGDDLATKPTSEVRTLWGQRIGMVLQDPLTSLNPVRRIGVQLTETIRRHHPEMSRREAHGRAVELMESVGIADAERRLTMYPHQFSGGMRQRVMIAIAVSGPIDLLIADEPTTALDVSVQHQILDLLNSYREERGMSMILVTHDLAIAAGRTDRIIVMYAGEVVESAPTRELFANVRMPYTRALLDAAPSVSLPSGTRIESIPGQPPDLATMPRGCRFADRCAHVREVCRETHPPLTTDPDGHEYRCWFPLGSAKDAVVPSPASRRVEEVVARV